MPSTVVAVLTLMLVAGTVHCSDVPAAALRTCRDPSFGWTISVPAEWVSCEVPGGRFCRGLPTVDPTRLVVRTCHDMAVAGVMELLAREGGVIGPVRLADRTTRNLRWVRYRAGARDDPDLSIEIAIAPDGADCHLIVLVARQAEAAALSRAVCEPAIDSFVNGAPDRPVSVLADPPPRPVYWPTRGWRSAAPESQGIDGGRLRAAVDLIRRESLPIDSVTVVGNGYVVLDESFPPYVEGTLHDLHSVTKSITSALVGIAFHESSLVPGNAVSVDTPVLDLLPSPPAARADARRRAMTIGNLLTMQSGISWSEWNAPYEPGSSNDLVAMVESGTRWTRYLLDLPMANEPGTVFSYNSGASYLLSGIVSRMTGMPAAGFASNRLFGPLGISEFDWPSGPEGHTLGWGALRLRPLDLARLGLLYLQAGVWDDRQIVPAEWVRASTTDRIVDPDYDYGYQWWLDAGDGYAYMSGRFGQTVIVAPRQNMVIVITARLPETAGAIPRWLAERYILPAVR